MILELRVSKSFGALVVPPTRFRSTCRGRGARHHRAERRRQDDAVQPDRRRAGPSAGQVLLDGATSPRTSASSAALAGIGRSHQIPAPFEKLTVFENLLVAACFGRGKRERRWRILWRDPRGDRAAEATRPTGSPAR
jgi:branched-chain amino acid transport system ATP-binding protein